MDTEAVVSEAIDARADEVLAALGGEEAVEAAATGRPAPSTAEEGTAEEAAAREAPSDGTAPTKAAPSATDDGRRTAVAERQDRARRIEALVDELRFRDPVLQEGARTDWNRLARENPAAFNERFPAYQSRLAALDAARRERERIAEEDAAQATLDRERELLVKAAPELGEPARLDALRREVGEFLQDAGFSGQEIRQIADHRALLIVRDAMRWCRQEKAREGIAAKRVDAAAPKTLRPAAANESGVGSGPRLDALKRRANVSGKLDDRAAYVLAALDRDG